MWISHNLNRLIRLRRFINIRFRNFRLNIRNSLFSIRKLLGKLFKRRINVFKDLIWSLPSLDKARGVTRRLNRKRINITIVTAMLKVNLNKGPVNSPINHITHNIISHIINHIIKHIINISNIMSNRIMKIMSNLMRDIKID